MRTFKENLLISLKKFRFIKITVFKIKQLAFYVHNLILQMELKNKSDIVILPHEGLGDLVVLIPALNKLSKRYNKVYIALNRWVQKSIVQIYDFPENITFLNFEHDKSYDLSKEGLDELSQFGKLIKLGRYGYDPIFEYPNSFYINLGVSTDLVGKKIDFKKDKIDPDFKIPETYIYCNLQTSLGKIQESFNDKNNLVVYRDKTSIGIGSSSESLQLFDVQEDISLLLNLNIALNADEIHVSDAGFFNILIHIEDVPPIFVYTRPHSHSHNRKLYDLEFDGSMKIIGNSIK